MSLTTCRGEIPKNGSALACTINTHVLLSVAAQRTAPSEVTLAAAVIVRDCWYFWIRSTTGRPGLFRSDQACSRPFGAGSPEYWRSAQLSAGAPGPTVLRHMHMVPRGSPDAAGALLVNTASGAFVELNAEGLAAFNDNDSVGEHVRRGGLAGPTVPIR